MTTESISGLDLQGSSLDVAVKMVCYNVWILHAEEEGIAGQRVYSGCQNTARFVITFV